MTFSPYFLRSNSGGVSRGNEAKKLARIVIKSVEHVEHKLIILCLISVLRFSFLEAVEGSPPIDVTGKSRYVRRHHFRTTNVLNESACSVAAITLFPALTRIGTS